jgi:hypothetical protein
VVSQCPYELVPYGFTDCFTVVFAVKVAFRSLLLPGIAYAAELQQALDGNFVHNEVWRFPQIGNTACLTMEGEADCAKGSF